MGHSIRPRLPVHADADWLAVLPPAVQRLLHSIDTLVCDVDGVLTNGARYESKDGLELVRFHARDGLGIMLSELAGIRVALVTSGSSAIVTQRAQSLKVSFVAIDVPDKIKVVQKLSSMSHGGVAFVGDDLWDVAAMRAADLSFAVADAVADVHAVADFTCDLRGGHGAVRQVIDLLLLARGIDGADLLGKIGEHEESAGPIEL